MTEPGRRVPAGYSRTSLYVERRSRIIPGVSNVFVRFYLSVLSAEYSDFFGRCLGERFLYELRACRFRSNLLLVFSVRAVAYPIFGVFRHRIGASTVEPTWSLSSGPSPGHLCPFGNKETMLGYRLPSAA